MRFALPWMFAVAATVAAVSAQERHALSVVFVQADSEAVPARTAAFTTFMRERFVTVQVLAPAELAVAALADVDVVLLDWSQSDGVMKWMTDKGSEIVCPLGERAYWRTPTVLLGSAGLNLAVAWDVRGGSG